MTDLNRLQSFVGLLVLTFFTFGCAEGGFHSGPIALKPVPIDSSEDQNFDDYENDVLDGTHSDEDLTEISRVTTLREKVLKTSDIAVQALDNALQFYDANLSIIRNRKYITIFDITKHSGHRRLYIINTETGSVRTMHVAHGKNSDRNNDGVANEFSNTSGSLQSSLGFVLTAETYYGGNGYSLRLDGLEDRNSKVRPRLVVIHGADYVSPNKDKMGRSYGCPAVSMANIKELINDINSGSLVYTYHAAHDG